MYKIPKSTQNCSKGEIYNENKKDEVKKLGSTNDVRSIDWSDIRKCHGHR